MGGKYLDNRSVLGAPTRASVADSNYAALPNVKIEGTTGPKMNPNDVTTGSQGNGVEMAVFTEGAGVILPTIATIDNVRHQGTSHLKNYQDPSIIETSATPVPRLLMPPNP